MLNLRLLTISAALAVSPAFLGAQQGAVRPVWPDEGPLKWAPRPTSADITADDLRTRLYQFADDSMQGRRIGEPGNVKGTDYIASEFRRLGLRPAGENGTYFQTLPYGPIGFDSAGSRLSVGSAALIAGRDFVPETPSAANGFAAHARIENVQTVFAGPWTGAVTLDPARFRGKVAVFLDASAPPTGGRGGGRGGPASFVSCADLPDLFGAQAVIANQQANASGRGGGRGGGGRGRGGDAPPNPFAEAGVAGVLIVRADQFLANSAGTNFGGRQGMRPATLPGENSNVAAATISRAAAQRLFGRAVDQLQPGATGQPVTGSWAYGWRVSPHPARNVIAILPGSDPARTSEYVLVGAHPDHVGMTSPIDHDSLRAVNYVTRRQGANDRQCAPTADQQRQIDSIIARARSIRAPRMDSVMNGADDDGSGSMVMLEIAERFASERPARSIVFIAHQGEESGLLGSRYFTDNPTIPLENVVAAHNMDMVGKGRVWQVKYGGPASVQMLGARRLSREFGNIIDSVNATRDEVMAIDKTWDVPENPLNRFCRSDQVSYVRHNVPVTYFSLGYSLDYHQATDDPQYIDYEHSARLGRFIHDVMMAIAMRRDRPAIAGPDPNYPSC